MFLSTLNIKERKVFGSLITKIAHIDGDLADEEKTLINNFKAELEIEELNELDLSIEEAIDKLSKSSEVVKRAIFLEIVSLILSDEEVTVEESDVVDRIAISFSIQEDKDKFYESVKELKSIYGRIIDLVYVE